MNFDMKLRPEEELLLCCARSHIDVGTTKKIISLMNKEFEWDYLIDFASSHSLRSLLYFQLNQICPEKVPSQVMIQLKDHYNSNARRNLLMMGELFKILNILKSEGINAVPYKGPVLAADVYGSISIREFVDLDIFIDKNDVLQVKELLISSGYEPKLKLSTMNELQYLKMQREYQFINKESGVSVEIQWNLPDISLSFPDKHLFTMDQIKTKSTEINNKVITTFSDEDLLLILSLHTVTHLWSKLSWICDIAELIKRSSGLNWDRIIEESQYLAVERIVYLNLSLASELFDIELPKDIVDKIELDDKIESLKRDIKLIMFDSKNCGFLKYFFLRFKIREKRKNNVKDFLKLFVIPTSTEWETFQRSSQLKLLYLLFRPIHLFNKIIK